MKTVIEMAREAEIGDSHGHMIRNELSNDKPAAQRQWVELTDVQREALADARNEAMLWAMKGRIPECGAFSGIAQNLDWLCDQFAIEAKLREKNGGAA